MLDTNPEIAFPYKAPTKKIKKKYSYLFNLSQPIKMPYSKRVFDIIISILSLVIAAPIILLIIICYKIEGIFDSTSAGPTFFFYWAVTQGRKMKKIKIRLIKQSFIIQKYAKNQYNSDVMC